MRQNAHIAAFLLPALSLVIAFYVLPNLLNFSYSFTDWSTYRTQVRFIGLDNFRDLGQEGTLWNSLFITIKYALAVMVIENAVALALALALEDTTRMNGFFRSIFFLPVLISSLAAGYVFKGILDPNGALNGLLSTITHSDVETPWLGSTTFTLFIIAVVHAWKWGGIHMLVYIAGLNSIPRELIDAARAEGAGPWQLIRRIKLPLLGPAFTFNITLTLIGALSVFDVVLAMTKGGPARATEVLNLLVWVKYGTGFLGYATTISLVLFLVICLTAFPLITYLRRREVEL